MSLGQGDSWDETVPDNDTDANKIDNYNIDLRKGTRIRAEKEHETFAASSVGGRHKFMTLQNQASKPTLADSQVAAVYSKGDVLYYEMAAGTEVAITNSAGVVNIPAMDMITRGFGLTYNAAGSFYVEPGTLFHSSTRVNTTARTTLTPATDADWVDGSQPASLADIWAYVVVKSDGTIKLEETSPAKADTSGNTVGKLIYHLEGSTYWRWAGGVRLDGSGNIKRFLMVGDLVIWDLWSYTDLLSAGAATSWTNVDCSSYVPGTSRVALAIAKLHTASTGNDSVFVREDGSSSAGSPLLWSNNDYFNNFAHLALSSAQVFEYKVTGATAANIGCQGYYDPRN